MFSPRSRAYTAELSEYMARCQGLSSITKHDFFWLFYRAWESSFTPKNIQSAFRSTGLREEVASEVSNAIALYTLEDIAGA